MGKASDRRLEQVKSLLQRTLDELIREELKDPRIGIFSLTEIHLSRDLSHADILIAVVGGRQATDESVAVLNRAAPLLWNRLREATDLRSVPRLRFLADHRGEYADRIFTLLEDLQPDSDSADDDGMDTETLVDAEQTDPSAALSPDEVRQ
ncbi:30S ribosome-binding factor RbfA [bacterium]|nr:30S ribosome-binding factor RbfA [bacterium]